MLARLVCVGGEGRDYEMRKTQVVLGRQPSGKTPASGATAAPDFAVGTDKTISRQHARITCKDHHAEEPQSFRIECLCKNGLTLNQSPVEQSSNPRKLHPNDIIQIGSVKLRFEHGDRLEPADRSRRAGESIGGYGSRRLERTSPGRRMMSPRERPRSGSPSLRLEPAPTPSRLQGWDTPGPATRSGFRGGGEPMLTAYKQLSGAVLGVLRSPDDGSEYGPLDYRTAARTLFLRPYLAHFCPVFSRFFAVFSVLTPGFQKVAPKDRGPVP